MQEVKTVLVVEDNPIIRDLMRYAVARYSRDNHIETNVCEVGDGAEALDILQDHNIDLLVCDLYMPVLGGIELIERVRSNPDTQSLKVLAMSSSFIDARTRSLDAGANLFLQKPLQLCEVLNAFGSLLSDDSAASVATGSLSSGFALTD